MYFYSDEIIANKIVKVLWKYGFEKKLGYFILDNTTSNNPCVEAIFAKIWPDLTWKKYKLWYVGYIINLVAKVFYYEKTKEVFSAEVYNISQIPDIKKQFKVWKKKNPLANFKILSYLLKDYLNVSSNFT